MTVAFACGVFVAVMVGAAYAAVPFYNWFCRTTGYGGIPLISKVAPAGMLKRMLLDTLGTTLAANTLGDGCGELVTMARNAGGAAESTLIATKRLRRRSWAL